MNRGLAGDVMVGGSLGCSKMIDLIMGEIENLVLQRVHFALFWRLVQSPLGGNTED